MPHYKDQDNGVHWLDSEEFEHYLPAGCVQITDEEAVQLNAVKQQSFFDGLSYADKRRSEYPPLTDYLDGVVKGDQAQIDAYIAACLTVKAKYPKP